MDGWRYITYPLMRNEVVNWLTDGECRTCLTATSRILADQLRQQAISHWNAGSTAEFISNAPRTNHMRSPAKDLYLFRSVRTPVVNRSISQMTQNTSDGHVTHDTGKQLTDYPSIILMKLPITSHLQRQSPSAKIDLHRNSKPPIL